MFNVELRGINLRAGVQFQTQSVQLFSCNFLIWTGFNIATIVIINIIECAQQCTSVLDCFREENRCDYMIVHCSAGWCRLIRPKHRHMSIIPLSLLTTNTRNDKTHPWEQAALSLLTADILQLHIYHMNRVWPPSEDLFLDFLSKKEMLNLIDISQTWGKLCVVRETAKKCVHVSELYIDTSVIRIVSAEGDHPD